MKSSRTPVQDFFLISIVFISSILFVKNNWDPWNQIHQHETRYWQLAVNVALDSGACAAKSKVILVGSAQDGNLCTLRAWPDYNTGDDIGFAIVMNLRSALNGKAPRVTDSAQNNLIITFVSILALLPLIRGLATIEGTIAITLFISILSTRFDPGTHGYNLGAVLLTILPALALIRLSDRPKWRWREWSLVILALFGFTLAAFMREAIATMGLLCFAGVGAIILGWRLLERRQQRTPGEKFNWREWFAQGKNYWVFLLLLLSYKVQNLLVWFGGWLYNVPAQRAAGNGSADNFLIGLGAVPNSLGIKLDDGYAEMQARLVNPDVIWMSSEYYRIIWKLYFQLWRDHPGELLRIYGEKVLISLKLIDFPVLYLLSSAAFISYLVRYWRRKGLPKSTDISAQTCLLFVLALAMGGLFFLQGLIFVPGDEYGYPALVFPALILVAALGLRRRLQA